MRLTIQLIILLLSLILSMLGWASGQALRFGRVVEENCPEFPEYTAMHWAAMLGRGPVRYLVTYDIDGLADRYVNAASAFIVALITNRVLCIHPAPPVHKSGPFQPPLETAFDAPFIDWTCPGLRPLEDPNLTQSSIDTAVRDWGDLVLVKGQPTPLYKLFIESNLLELEENEADVFKLLVHRGLTVGMFKNKNHAQQVMDFGLKPETAFGCITSYLFRPNRHSFTLVSKNLMSLMTDEDVIKIGIQIRSGDKLIQHNADMTEITDAAFDRLALPYFECAETLEADIRELNPDQKDKEIFWYLMTDSLAIRGAALKRYPEKIRHYNETEIEFFKTVTEHGLRHTLMEHWLLQQSHHHIITRTSGLGRTAAYASLRRNSVFTMAIGSVGNLKEEGQTSKREAGRGCKVADGDTVDLTYATWSGI